MLKIIKNFYNRTKLKDSDEIETAIPPISHIKIFYKDYPRLPQKYLNQEKNKSEFETLLDMRKSYREFSTEPITFNQLSKTLLSCRNREDSKNTEMRTYPSGGARFPIETYLVAYNIEDLKKGAYHYNLKNKSLELLLEKDLKQEQRKIISPYLENPAATIVFTSVIPRSEVKYGIRSYPYSLIESGHMAQNMLLSCAEQGIGGCPVSGFVDETIKKILDLLDNEIPIYTISIGKVKRG